MEILDLIDLGIKMENGISALYGLAAQRAASSNPEFVSQLKTLSREEVGHANALRLGRNFVAEMPDLFSAKPLDFSEIQRELKETESIMDKLTTDKDLRFLLASLLDLEKRFERLHLGQSLLIKDGSLKSLFVSLSKGDSAHISTVSAILSGLDG